MTVPEKDVVELDVAVIGVVLNGPKQMKERYRKKIRYQQKIIPNATYTFLR
jgi:hypothetical protein